MVIMGLMGLRLLFLRIGKVGHHYQGNHRLAEALGSSIWHGVQDHDHDHHLFDHCQILNPR
jgi:hypothetical protein